MAEYNPSKIIKDGNTYNFRDTTKIPLAGSNQISGSLIPATDNSIDIGSSTKNLKMLYTKGITIDGAQFSPSDYVLPTGSYIQFAGSQAPAGFLVCNGGAISRTTYSALFAVIGTTYGSGDGSTTFNLPNLTDRFLQGSTISGTVKNAGLPNITGGISIHGSGTGTNLQSATGSFAGVGVRSTYYGGVQTEGASSYDGFDLEASLSNSIYGNSSTVQPPALTCLICIKY